MQLGSCRYCGGVVTDERFARRNGRVWHPDCEPRDTPIGEHGLINLSDLIQKDLAQTLPPRHYFCSCFQFKGWLNGTKTHNEIPCPSCPACNR